jgi:CheY-like chemotaxis protein
MGEDGLEIGKLYDYDIIILDLMLPDMDGYEVLRRLRAARVKTPILILSGLSGLDEQDQGARQRRRRLPDQAVRQTRSWSPVSRRSSAARRATPSP